MSERSHSHFSSWSTFYLTCRYEELAAKYGVSLEWQGLGQAADRPSDSAEESKTQNGLLVDSATLEAVEQKIKASEAAQRFVRGLIYFLLP